jgi:RNA-directed DNA polymerase
MATTGVERRAHRARQEAHTRYTSLRHHCTVEKLRAGFESLEAQQAIGGDGITKARYGQDLEANLQGRHDRRHQMSYRPQPVRRVEIPKDDGRTRPLGISGVEDKIGQEMVRRVLDALYEPGFMDTA